MSNNLDQHDEEFMDDDEYEEEQGSAIGNIRDALKTKPVKIAIGVGAFLFVMASFFAVKAMNGLSQPATSHTPAAASSEDLAAAKNVAVSSEREASDVSMQVFREAVEQHNAKTEAAIRSDRFQTGAHTIPQIVEVDSVKEVVNVLTDAPIDNSHYGLRVIYPSIPTPIVVRNERTEEELRAIVDRLSKYRTAERRPSSIQIRMSGSSAGDDSGGTDANAVGLTPAERIVTGQHLPAGIGGSSTEQRFGERELLMQGMDTVLYAKPMYRINSDVNAPVALEIVAGKWKGAKLLGSYQANEQIDGFRLQFNRLTLPDGTDVAINAIGLDEQTTDAAVDAEVDRHFLYRYGWWGIGVGLSALSAAILADSTVVANDSTIVESRELSGTETGLVALGNLGRDVAQMLRSRVDRPPTYKLDTDTLVGVFVLDDVYPKNTNEWLVDPTTRERLESDATNLEIQRRTDSPP